MNQRLKRLLGALTLVAVMVSVASLSGLFHSTTSRLQDRLFTDRKTDSRILLVAIDDTSLARIGRWPWDRSVHAELIRRLTQAGVIAIGVDVNFPEVSNTSDDTELASAISQAKMAVLPIELSDVRFDGDRYTQYGTPVRSISTISAGAFGAGYTNLPLDDDNVSRRIPLVVETKDGGSINSFAEEVLKAAGITVTPPPLDHQRQFVIHYPSEPGSMLRVSAADVLQGKTDLSNLKGKIVFIGATARDLHDEQLVPTSNGVPMSGVEIHASIADTLVSKAWLQDLSVWIQLMLLIVLTFVSGLTTWYLRPRWSVLIHLGLLVVMIVTGITAFDRGVLMDLLWPIITLLLSFGVVMIYRVLTSEQDRRELKQVFARYVSPSVVDEISKDPTKVRLGGDRRTMTVLFSDLRGFTTLSEGLSPEQLVDVLNLYLDEMTKIVFNEGGVLDKYIGDAVMAFWNAPMDQTDHADRALRCALAMKSKLAEMNRLKQFPNGLSLKVGIGINTGDMVVGNIGSSLRHDYTVIGDSVNLASRTESLCKDYGTEIIITKNTLDSLSDNYLVRELDQVAVKGKSEPIRIYEVIDIADHASEAQKQLVTAYSDALSLYYTQRFTEAKQAFLAIVASFSDIPAQIFVERCDEFESNPPAQDWNGVYVRKTK